MSEVEEVRSTLQKFQDGYSARDASQIEAFMELFVKSDEIELVGVGATKRGGKAGRKSQCLDSTVEAGEQSSERTPGREARHRDHGTDAGKYDECLEIR